MSLDHHVSETIIEMERPGPDREPLLRATVTRTRPAAPRTETGSDGLVHYVAGQMNVSEDAADWRWAVHVDVRNVSTSEAALMRAIEVLLDLKNAPPAGDMNLDPSIAEELKGSVLGAEGGIAIGYEVNIAPLVQVTNVRIFDWGLKMEGRDPKIGGQVIATNEGQALAAAIRALSQHYISLHDASGDVVIWVRKTPGGVGAGEG